MNKKFTVSTGRGGSIQLTYYYCDKVNLAELDDAIVEVFPGVERRLINSLPGLVNCVFTTGKDLEL